MVTLKEHWDGFTQGAQAVVVIAAMLAIGLSVGLFIENSRPPQAPEKAVSPEELAQRKLLSSAMDACESAVMASATNRSSVKFRSPDPLPRARQKGDGNFEVFTKFAAKNGFGSESVSLARCVIASDGRALIELTAQDAR